MTRLGTNSTKMVRSSYFNILALTFQVGEGTADTFAVNLAVDVFHTGVLLGDQDGAADGSDANQLAATSGEGITTTAMTNGTEDTAEWLPHVVKLSLIMLPLMHEQISKEQSLHS